MTSGDVVAIWLGLSLGAGAIAIVQLLRLHQQRRWLLDDPVRRRFFLQHGHQQVHHAHTEGKPTRMPNVSSPQPPAASRKPAAVEPDAAPRPTPPVPAMPPVPAPTHTPTAFMPERLPLISIPLATPLGSPTAPAATPADEGIFYDNGIFYDHGIVYDKGILYVDAAGRCTLADDGAREILHWNDGERMLSDMLVGGTQESTALLSELARQGSVDAYPTALTGPAAAPVEVSAVALRDRDDGLWGAVIFIHRPAAAMPAPQSAPSPH